MIYKTLWKDRGFEILVGLCLLFILLYYLYRKISGKSGMYRNPRGDLESLFSDIYMDTHAGKRKYTRGITTQGNIEYKKPSSTSKGELECRRVLENIFGVSFSKSRPRFLNNPVTGGTHNMELDCFNEKLGIACEYNGIQHYKYTPFFHSNKDAFENQKYRDELKRRMCKDNGILLIEVPYDIPHHMIESYIMKELKSR